MKAEVFAAGFLLVFAGAWFTYAKHNGSLHFKGMNDRGQNIVISSDNFYEEINYSGKISFSDDETAIDHIAPGGYIKYTKNEQVMQANSDSGGNISYQFTKGGHKLAADSSTKKIITEAVAEMIAWGFDAKERMDRIYKKGGYTALMEAMGQLKNDGIKRMYAEKIVRTDSLSPAALADLSQKITAAMGNSYDREQVLKMYTAKQLQDSAVMNAYLQAVASLDNDNAKAAALKNVLTLPLNNASFPAMFTIITRLNDDYQKKNLFSTIINKGQMDTGRAIMLLQGLEQMDQDNEKQELLLAWINKGTMPVEQLDKVLLLIKKFGSDMDKETMYKKLAAESIRSDEQWIKLIGEAANINQNEQKANLLTDIAKKMPRTEAVKTAYAKVARTISGDMEYGRAIRAAE